MIFSIMKMTEARMRSVVLLSIGAATVAFGLSCQVTHAQNAPVSGFQCPPAGTVVTYGDGGRVTWRGPDPNDPALCRRTAIRPEGEVNQRLPFSIWSYSFDQNSLPQIRSGLAPLFPLAIGKRVYFSRTGPDARGQSQLYSETWRVEGRENLVVGGRTREVWRIRRSSEFQGSGSGSFSGELIMRVDVATHIVLKQDVESGAWARGNAWAVTSLTFPAPR
jgi:hypothetical protein